MHSNTIMAATLLLANIALADDDASCWTPNECVTKWHWDSCKGLWWGDDECNPGVYDGWYYANDCKSWWVWSSDYKCKYDRFANLMYQYDYTWEPVKVTTEDGYILTTFHVTGNSDGPLTPTMPPVLIQHGDYGDGAEWLGAYADGLPMHLQLAEAGYDVWIGNNRGTEYSQKHITLKKWQPEFWAWTWAEMGIYDDVANIKAIKEKSGADKAFYLGYSQGTVQMFYALAHREQEFFADNLHKFVALAPCTICPDFGKPESYYEGGLYSFPSIRVHNMYGPKWPRNHKKVCRKLGKDACDYAGEQTDWAEPVSVQSEIHWWQNTYTNRFQEYAPKYMEGERETELINLAGITQVPISMLVGTADRICPYSEAEKTAKIIGDAVVHFETIQDVNHGYFAGENGEWFMNLVISQLQVPKRNLSEETADESIKDEEEMKFGQ